MKKPFTHGQATLHNTDALAWLAKAPEKSVHAVVTDPPYGVNEYTSDHLRKLREGKGGIWRIPPTIGGHTRAPLPRFTEMKSADLEYLRDYFTAWATVLLPTLVPGAHVMMACNPLVSPWLSMALTDAGLERRGEIIRRVQTMRGGDRPKNAHQEFDGVSVMPRSQWEPWLLYRRPIECNTVADNLRKYKTGGLRRISEDQPFGDVIKSSPTGKREKKIANHPSLKPQAFLRQVVRAALPLGEGVVLDPFAGSGSTLAAAEAVGYTSIGLERDPDYFDLAKKAIPQLAAFTPTEATDD